jgi:hypothetical protein
MRMRVAFGAAISSLLVSMALSGCAAVNSSQLKSSEFVADHVPTWADGESPDAPARSATPPPYPNAFTTPPVHQTKVMTDEEEKRAEADLTSAREGTTGRAKATVVAEKKRAAELAALAAAHERLAGRQPGATSN